MRVSFPGVTAYRHSARKGRLDGFAAAALLAAAVAAAMALFTVLLVRRAETLPVTLGERMLINDKVAEAVREAI
jgi:hypothetical protein